MKRYALTALAVLASAAGAVTPAGAAGDTVLGVDSWTCVLTGQATFADPVPFHEAVDTTIRVAAEDSGVNLGDQELAEDTCVELTDEGGAIPAPAVRPSYFQLEASYTNASCLGGQLDLAGGGMQIFAGDEIGIQIADADATVTGTTGVFDVTSAWDLNAGNRPIVGTGVVSIVPIDPLGACVTTAAEGALVNIVLSLRAAS